MSGLKNNTPVYKQFIELIRNGYNILDDKTKSEVKNFIIQSQNKDGGFINRTGNSDLYYSLFGFWIASALDLHEQLELIKKIITKKEKNKQITATDKLAFFAIRTGLLSKKASLLKIFKVLIKKDFSVNYSYKIFLFIILTNPENLLSFLLKFLLRFYRLPDNSPCSSISALVFVKYSLKLDVSVFQDNIINYYEEEKGFKAFKGIESADLLSTAVALFTLFTTEYDIRLIAPTCLKLVQNNYLNGSFLSGNGDNIPDIEYTFYGLLILGILSIKYK